MDLRRTLYALLARGGREAAAAPRPHREPPGLAERLPRVLAVLAAALAGLGLVFWVAANWNLLGRFGQFVLLQAAVLGAAAAAWRVPRARTACGLAALLAIGALFAFFGQTYQTGADPWQLFALWAVLALPLCLGVRHDALWVPWLAVAVAALALWVQAHTGHRWRVEAQDFAVQAAAAGAAMLLPVAAGPLARRWTGTGRWALRTALLLAVALVTALSLGALLHARIAPHYALGLVLLGGAAAVLARPAAFEIFGLSAAALGINILLVGGLAHLLLRLDGAGAGLLSGLGLAAAVLLAATVSGVLRLWRRRARVAQPPDVPLTGEPARPWPVVGLTALGAWLAALPLIGAVATVFTGVAGLRIGASLLGLALLAVAVKLLRARGASLFVEQLAVPLLATGAGALAMGLAQALPLRAVAAVMGLVAAGVAFAVAQPWLQVLAGAAIGVAVAVLCGVAGDGGPAAWLAVHASLAGSLVLRGLQRTWRDDAARAAHAARLESLLAGWWLAVLALAAAAGWAAPAESVSGMAWSGAERGVSIALTIAAAAWLARRWPSVRHAWAAAAALVAAVLAGFMPVLGAALWVAARCAGTGRWRLAAAGASAVALIVGRSYADLGWPLADKAALLVAAGAVLAAFAVGARRGPWRAAGRRAPASVSRWRGASIAAGALATLVVANLGIADKEALIARGEPVYIALAPVDPRSLMQGDYMRLNFALPAHLQRRLAPPAVAGERPRLVMRRDARGVATPLRLDTGAPLGPGELRFELAPKNGRWVFVSDAWYFEEGEAARWAAAAFGEFRVDADGQALLVGLRGQDLQAL